MRPRRPALFVAAALLATAGPARAGSTVLAIDGIWSMGIEARESGGTPMECWASRILQDGTTLTLAARHAQAWSLRLSNTDWQLTQATTYAASALVDFYPPVPVTIENSSRTTREIRSADPESELIDRVYFGHSIKLTLDGTTTAFDLEGSAKAIEWVRTCARQVH